MSFSLALLSGSLLCLPIIVTGGIYTGVESQKVIDLLHGKIPPQSGPGAPKIGSTGTYCQQEIGITPYPGRYIFNPNQWGDPQKTGSLCMNITTASNVKAEERYASNWTATWGYPQILSGEPVHAFPNAKLDSPSLPIQLSSLSTLDVDVQWSYSAGSTVAADLDLDALAASNCNANVAFDLFLSTDKSKSQSTTDASIEVMVWLGQFGAATQPLGLPNGPQDQFQVAGTTFDLYYDTNGNGQDVFTWVAEGNTTTFTGDISPLITRLSTIATGPQPTDYLGYVAFGSETFYSTGNVTMSVPKLDMAIAAN